MRELTASSVGEFATAIKEISYELNCLPWWRGHGRPDWELRSSLHRLDGLPHAECNMTQRFLLMAPARRRDCPRRDDYLGWLFLMQHYGLPTRLLDWTMSPLVALFFALESDETESLDAVLWALDPSGLNLLQAKVYGILTPDSAGVTDVAEEAFRQPPSKPVPAALAIHGQQADLRHLMQQSVFTLHGTSVSIETIEGIDRYLTRLVVPPQARAEFTEFMDHCGVSRSNLFPDLPSLAQDIADMVFAEPA